ncbi:Uncharacterized protein FWK35_00022987 [Aphis craccivora]|uniref:Uncharacterized protein n=1 Tax=Aphis craccivora TaxID=307492 RepID=A0A6G0ZIK8_APHCR|nr:Uncharacterized protein FWK35_00022987 [Aphis craccivora]
MRSIREGALCAGRLVRDVPVRSVRFPCNGHGGGVPTGPHPFARLVVGIFCMRHVKPSPSSRGAAASAGRRGEGGGGGVLRRVTTETTKAERAIGLRCGRGRGERAPWKGVRDRKPKPKPSGEKLTSSPPPSSQVHRPSYIYIYIHARTYE